MALIDVNRPAEEAVTSPGTPTRPAPWRYTTRGIAFRLFFTCWLIYSLHVATNTVRELYLALAIGDHLSFRVDDYGGIHPDLFQLPDRGWHIGNNPGASMLAAIPYTLARPVIDRVVDRVNRQRAASGQQPPAYESPWPMAQRFYQEAWRRGLDVKFGLAAIVMQVFCMAPISALAVVGMFYLLRLLLESDRWAFWAAILYAFGTPVFLRTGYINQNLLLGHIAFFGFLALWNPSGSACCSLRLRHVLGGLSGGAAVLMDYSGVVFLLGLASYALARRLRQSSMVEAVRLGGWYMAGAAGPILLLWFYQWQSFGNPFYPGQHYMPPVAWIERGYRGVSGPQLELLWSLAFDYRFGLFVSCPMMLLALAAPWARRRFPRLPALELAFLLGISAALWIFFSSVNYSRLQFNTGIRYLAPLFPFLFVPAVMALARLPRMAVYLTGVLSIGLGWCLAMYRDVERGLGVLECVLQIVFGGLRLPLLTVLSRMDAMNAYFPAGPSPLPLMLLAAAIVYGIWKLSPGGAGEEKDA